MDDCRQTLSHASIKRISSQSKTNSDESHRQQTSSVSPHKSQRNPSGGDFIHLPKLWHSRALSKRLLDRHGFQAKAAFKKAIGKVICLLKVTNAFLSFVGDGSLPEKYGSLQYFVNILDVNGNLEEEEGTGNEPNSQKPLFDPAWFRANREIRLGSETKAILSQEPRTRTPEQVQTVFRYLYTLPSFAEYPLYHQKAICQDATYQSFGANVTIIKQGDSADNFYFVLSGSATVISHQEQFSGENNGDVRESVSVIKRGVAFGETAIMTNSRRMVTVVSKTPIELLVVSKEDYARIFFGTDAESGKKEYISFLRTIDFLRDWPVDLLKSNPEKSQHCYFRRGTVIVRNSNNSQWLYVVKSGVCDVLIRLNTVKPRKAVGKEVRHLSCSEELTKLTLEQRLELRKRKMGKLPDVQHAYDRKLPASIQDVPRRRTTLCFVPKHSSSSSRRPSKDSMSARINAITEENVYTDHEDPNVEHTKAIPSSPDSSVANDSSLWLCNYSKLSKSLNQSCLGRKSSAESSKNNDCSGSFLKRARSLSLPSTITGELLKFRRQPKPAFVRIDLLHSKRVFGLSELDFEYNTLHTGCPASVSLVSRGAECIMISKKFFMEHANALTKRWVRLNVQPYLPLQYHQQTLQEKVDWEAYKKKIVASVVY